MIVLGLAVKRPLYQAVCGGLLTAAILYRIPPEAILTKAAGIFTNWELLSVLISLYLITYLQRMLEARDQIKLAQQDLNGLFHNRRIHVAASSLVIGLLPSAAAMLLSGELVKQSTKGYLKPEGQAFVTTWFRHIPESTLPTYAGILLMANFSGVSLGNFMLGMIVPMLTLGALGYFPYLRRLPKDPGTPKSGSRYRDLLHLLKHLWTLFLILMLILCFKLSVTAAAGTVIALAAVIYRFKVRELSGMLRSAFEVNLLLSTFLVLLLKELIDYGGVLEKLPAAFMALPIPS